MEHQETPEERREIVYVGHGAPHMVERNGTQAPITSRRYETATRALSDMWDQRPRAGTPERRSHEAGPLRAARCEVRAAWLETAGEYQIDPDIF